MEISDEMVSAFEAEYLQALYPEKRDFVLSSPGNRHFEGYRAGLKAALEKRRIGPLAESYLRSFGNGPRRGS